MKRVSENTLELSPEEVAIDGFFREHLQAGEKVTFAQLLAHALNVLHISEDDASVALIAWLYEEWGERCEESPSAQGRRRR